MVTPKKPKAKVSLISVANKKIKTLREKVIELEQAKAALILKEQTQTAEIKGYLETQYKLLTDRNSLLAQNDRYERVIDALTVRRPATVTDTKKA